MQSRRDLLKTAGGALIVSLTASAQGPFDTHPSHIDPKRLDSWLMISADGSVTARTGKCDLGQGIYTAQTQLVAEELCIPVSGVKLIQCDTAVTPDQGTTSGSQSTPTNFNDENLALAAATARETLLALAARKFGARVEELTAADGFVTGARGRVAYRELVSGKELNVALNPNAKRRSSSQWTVLGKAVPSLDHPDLMTGRFEFVQSVRVPGMLHGRVIRPSGMFATLAHVDADSVRDIPGFVKVVVRKNFVGVVAQTQYAAVLAQRRLKVRWNPGPQLPLQKTFYEHIQRQPSRDAFSVDSGDVTRRLTGGRLIRGRYTYPYQMHASLGTSCAVADVTSSAATIWSGTQSVYPTRSVVAKLLNMPLESVRVVFVRGSGCYGLNGADAVSFDAAVLSQEVGRPVRLQFSREDEMLWENLGAACVVEHRAALTADGTIQAWDREDWTTSLGNRPGYDRPGNVISGVLLGYEPAPFQPGRADSPKKFQNRSNTVPPYLAGCVNGECGGNGTIRSERVLTHTVRSPFFTGPLRSPLRIQHTFANESFMDELCQAAGADAVEFRLKHLKDERLKAVVEAAASAAKWTAGKNRGRGIACVDYEGGNGYAALVADVEVNADTGVVRPLRFFVALDCGPVSNPDGLRNQTEGGILQGMSRALLEEVTWNSERITSVDWTTYRSLRLDYEMPPIETVILNQPNGKALGAGETAITVTPAAIANAIADATGARLRTVPFTPDRVRAAIRSRRA